MKHWEIFVLGITVCVAVVITLFTARGIYMQNHPEDFVRLPPPTITAFKPADVLGQTPVYRGSATSPYVLVEFADFQCPACIASQHLVQQALSGRTNRIAMVFHNFPLKQHLQAMPAAQAVECARIQGKYWPMYDALFARKGHLDADIIQSVANKEGLNASRFNSDYNVAAKAAVERDIRLADKLKLDSTPTFFLCCPDHRVFRLISPRQIQDIIH